MTDYETKIRMGLMRLIETERGKKMGSIKSCLPNSDIKVDIVFGVRGTDVIYEGAYIGEHELLTDELWMRKPPGSLAPFETLTDYFNRKLQDKIFEILRDAGREKDLEK